MANTLSLNPQAAASRKRMNTQAEYAVASLINKMRHELGSATKQLCEPSEAFCDKATFQGSYFFSTDQMADNLMGNENFTRNTRVPHFDDWNIKHDIDLALCDMYKFAGNNTIRPVKNKDEATYISVKKMDRAVGSSMVNIELFTFNDRTLEQRDGWIKSGLSHFTAICLGTLVVIVKTSELKTLTMENDHIYKKFPHLTAERIEENKRQNRYYNDACNILVPLFDIKKLPSFTVLEMPKWYADKWKAKADEDLKEADAKRRKEWNV